MKRCRRLQSVLLIYLLAAITPLCVAQSVGYQITPDHTGQLYFPSMSPPLSMKWSASFQATVSFPIIVGNRVFVVSESSTGANSALYALDAQTGNVLWTQVAPQGSGWVGAAYESGALFALRDGSVFALAATDGHQLWSTSFQRGLVYPPTASNGVVYVIAEGPGSTTYAVRESDGAILWSASTSRFNTSTPAVTADGVYPSYACPEVYKFDPTTGQEIWGYDNQDCYANPGSAPAVYGGLIYARDTYGFPTDGITLRATDGAYVGGFDSRYAPAFWQNTAFYTEPNALTAFDLISSRYLWIGFPQHGDSFSCAPIVVDGVVYAGTAQGNLYGYAADTGSQLFSANVGQSISCPDIYYPPLAGLSAGAGLLVVPAGNKLVAFQFQNFGHWQFVPTTPCRLVDTRQTHNPIQGGTSQSFVVPQLGGCNIPSSALAYSLNVTVAPHRPLGYLTIWPNAEQQPTVSTMNSPDARVKANAAIVPAGYLHSVDVYASDTTDVILDINGYFTPPSSGTYQFYPLPPCRIVDTRGTNGPLGGPYLPAQQPRDFPILSSTCIPAGVNPSAYSLNVTVVPHPVGQPLGYLTLWPNGQPQPTVSTLNNLTATVVANAAIVPAGTGGDIEVYAYNTTDLLIDIDGYFAAPGNGGLSLYPAAPCRVLDTRQNNGQPFQGEQTVNVAGSACSPPSNAQAYVFNATVVPPASMPYLTLWPDGLPQPGVSTLNAYDGFITSNMSIVPTNNGSIDAYAAGLTQLILDISGYFAP